MEKEESKIRAGVFFVCLLALNTGLPVYTFRQLLFLFVIAHFKNNQASLLTYIWDCSFFSFFFANLCIANVSFRIMHLFATVWYIKPRQNWISVQIPGSKCTEYSRNVAALIANLVSFLPYSVCHFVLLLFCAVESIKEDSTSPYN